MSDISGKPNLKSANRWAVLLLLLSWSWVAMTVSHELGHVVGGCCSGAKVMVLELRPWQLPYSLYSPDPNPQITLWAGPLLGCIVPVLVAMTVGKPAVWFVSWFCVLANAIYLLVGYFGRVSELDTTKILNAGTPEGLFWLFVAITGPVSYVAFRSQCVKIMSPHQEDAGDAMSRQVWQRSLIVLIVVVAAQSVFATAIR